MSLKSDENWSRRRAASQGHRLVKSRRRTPSAIDYGRYWLVSLRNVTVLGDRNGVDLDTVNKWLAEEAGERLRMALEDAVSRHPIPSA